MTPGGKITPHLSFRNTCEEFVCDKMDKKKGFCTDFTLVSSF